jgi:hypothetical protein
VVPQVLCALEHHLFVIVELIAAATRPGLQDRAGVVVPLQAVLWLIPVDSPPEISRINVTGQALLIAMKLVADKVHLTSKGSVVALGSQVVGICWDFRVDLRGIVVGANSHGEEARDHAHAGRGAERGWAISRVELDRGLGKTVEIGGLDLGIGVVHLQLGGSELVSHDVENVGL